MPKVRNIRNVTKQPPPSPMSPPFRRRPNPINFAAMRTLAGATRVRTIPPLTEEDLLYLPLCDEDARTCEHQEELADGDLVEIVWSGTDIHGKSGEVAWHMIDGTRIVLLENGKHYSVTDDHLLG